MQCSELPGNSALPHIGEEIYVQESPNSSVFFGTVETVRDDWLTIWNENRGEGRGFPVRSLAYIGTRPPEAAPVAKVDTDD